MPFHSCQAIAHPSAPMLSAPVRARTRRSFAAMPIDWVPLGSNQYLATAAIPIPSAPYLCQPISAMPVLPLHCLPDLAIAIQSNPGKPRTAIPRNSWPFLAGAAAEVHSNLRLAVDCPCCLAASFLCPPILTIPLLRCHAFTTLAVPFLGHPRLRCLDDFPTTPTK